jgi:NAD(P)-dependent dehydrogenase (short-subunit alcohol dehydrogenase family)
MTEFVDCEVPSFVGKNVILLGATGGVGKIVASKLLRKGATVALLGRNIAALEGIGRQGQGIVFECDLGHPTNLREIFLNTMQRLQGRLDIFINCAGLSINKEFRETNLLEWDAVFRINTRSPMQLMSMAAPFLKLSGGSIVNVTSSPIPSPNALLQCVSKACMDMMTKCAALELANYGVRVNTVAAGIIDTAHRISHSGMSADDNARLLSDSSSRSPLKKVATALDIANSVIWLASDAASFINGQSLIVDGGASINFVASTMTSSASASQPSLQRLTQSNRISAQGFLDNFLSPKRT